MYLPPTPSCPLLVPSWSSCYFYLFFCEVKKGERREGGSVLFFILLLRLYSVWQEESETLVKTRKDFSSIVPVHLVGIDMTPAPSWVAFVSGRGLRLSSYAPVSLSHWQLSFLLFSIFRQFVFWFIFRYKEFSCPSGRTWEAILFIFPSAPFHFFLSLSIEMEIFKKILVQLPSNPLSPVLIVPSYTFQFVWESVEKFCLIRFSFVSVWNVTTGELCPAIVDKPNFRHPG